MNVVQNGNKEVLGVFAGDPVKAFEEGVAMARDIYEVPLEDQYEIVITVPGYPKSTDLYQATRAWNNVVFGPKPVVKKAETIIIPALCEKGFGHEEFYRILARAKDPDQVLDDAPRCGFEVGEHKAFIAAKVLKQARVMVTDCLIPSSKLREMFLEPVACLEEAVQLARAREKKPKILIIPHGLLTLPILKA